MVATTIVWAVLLHLSSLAASSSFSSGEETPQARCHHHNPDNLYRNVSMETIGFEIEMLKRAEGNRTTPMIRLGCPKGYKLFSEKQCISDKTLGDFERGEISWSQLLARRVRKSSLKNVNKDTGRCANYSLEEYPAEEFDDDHCVSLSMICSYKYGVTDFDHVLPHIERYPLGPMKLRTEGHSAPLRFPLPGGQNCGHFASSLAFGVQMEFDETHCVRKSTVEGYLRGTHTWDDVMAAKKSKVFLGVGSATTKKPRPTTPRTETEVTILQLVAPLIRNYIVGVVPRGVADREIWFSEPPGMKQQKNWKRIENTPYAEGHLRFGFAITYPASPNRIPPCSTPAGKRGRCKLLKDCFQPEFYKSLEAFVNNSCPYSPGVGAGVVGVCCPAGWSAASNSTRLLPTVTPLMPIRQPSWEQLMDFIDSDQYQLALATRLSDPSTTPRTRPKTLSQEESVALDLLKPIIRGLTLPQNNWTLPEVNIKLPDDKIHQLKLMKNFRTQHSNLNLGQIGFGFGNRDWGEAFLSCFSASGQRGQCKLVAQCPRPELFRSVDTFLSNSCLRGGNLAVCCVA